MSMAHTLQRPVSPVLEAVSIRKSFSGVEVLHGVDFELLRGEVHGIVGQNGAGKSTLMKILAGVYDKDAGEIRRDGTVVELSSPAQARSLGIAMVFQEFSLVPSLSVADNMFLGREPRRGRLFMDYRRAVMRARELLDELGVSIDPRAPVETLSMGSRQLVEIAKAMSQDAAILILDEPTASLSQAEIATLFSALGRLRSSGISVVFISHHLNEVRSACDRITVLRDGNVTVQNAQGMPLEEMIRAMLGSSLSAALSWRNDAERAIGAPVLEVTSLTTESGLREVSFSLRSGEILGIAGLLGSGRSELLRALYGVDRATSGTIRVNGAPQQIRRPSEAIEAGLALIPEDRRRAGLFPGHSVRWNVLASVWQRLGPLRFWVDDRQGSALVSTFTKRLDIRAASQHQAVERLSGGNQQKVVVAKGLSTRPGILLLDDPTVGIDVEARKTILDETRAAADAGNAVMLVSSEFEELSAVCDRVLILRHGRVEAELDRASGDAITEESLSAAVQTPVTASPSGTSF